MRRSDSPYLFVSRQSGKMNPSRINQIFNQYSDVITPKTLRHYFCSHALETGYVIHDLDAYKSQEYYDAHPRILLLAPDRNYAIEIFAGYVASVD